MGVSETRPARRRPLSPTRDPVLLITIGVGGALGTLTRASLSGAFPHPPGAWPWATFTINIVGALVLSFLLEALGRRGPDVGVRRLVRLGGGTGFLGGFTTYSTFAVETVTTLSTAPVIGVGYLSATVIGGPLAAVGGYALARRFVPSVRKEEVA